jgi:broad-specificity NMP kinase
MRKAFQVFMRKICMGGPGNGRSTVPRRLNALKEKMSGFSSQKRARGRKTTKEINASITSQTTACLRLPLDWECSR